LTEREVYMHVGSVHHVALGVKDLEMMRRFYENTLQFNMVFLEIEEAEHSVMCEVLRTPRVVFSGVSFGQGTQGIALELIRLVDPVPRPIRKDFRYGDIGVGKITIAVSDVAGLYKEMKDKVNFCSEPRTAVIPRWGDYHFVYCRDPEGNIIEFVSGANLSRQAKFGGVRWVGIGVTDLDRSVSFYKRHLGLDGIFIDIHESFSGLVDELAGAAGARVRSCLLGSSKDCGMVELFEVVHPRGRSIPFGVNFGDFGYLQICFYHTDIDRITASCRDAGIEFLCNPKVMDDGIPEHAGSFIYIKDPDGIPVEFLVLHHLTFT
jgi:catechol 2,3-dioxygenase-like lactoylglutathione lyase family enzyme